MVKFDSNSKQNKSSAIVPLARSKEEVPPNPVNSELVSDEPETDSAPMTRPRRSPPPISRPLAASMDDMHDRMPRRYEDEFEDKARRPGCAVGCAKMLLSCRCLFFGCFLFLLLIIVAGILIFTQRPPFIYNPMVDWLNAGLEPQPQSELTLNEVTTELQGQLAKMQVGDNKLIITEPQLQAVLRDKLVENQLKELNVELKENVLKMYWNISAEEQKKLWAVLELGVDSEGKPVVYKLGTERIPLPTFTYNLLQGVLGSVLNLSGQDEKAGLFGVFLNLPDNVSLKSVQIFDDRVEMVLNITTGLDNIFGE